MADENTSEKTLEKENNAKAEETAGQAAKEKKSVSEKGKKISAKKILARPVFVSAIALIIIAAGAIMIVSMNQPEQLTINDFEHANIEKLHKLKIIILTSSECKDCKRDNSFINQTLLENNIIPLGEEIDVNSEEGREILKTFGIRQVPFVILDATSIDETMKIKLGNSSVSLGTLLEENLRQETIFKKGDFYLIPESERVVMLLDANGCGSKEKIQVDLFTDPYCAPCALATPTLADYMKTFDQNIDFNYNFLPIDSKKMLYKWEKISPFANYSICASRQGAFEEFLMNAYAYYCNPDKNIYDLNSLLNCAKSSAFRVPMPKERLLEAIAFANLDKTELGKCLEQIEKDKPKMIETAQSYGIYEVPKILLNCRYVSHAEYIKDAICAVNPQLEECKKKQ